MSEEKTGVFINGEFIECNTSCLEILVKGKVQNLNVGKNNSNTMTMKVSHTTMNMRSNYCLTDSWWEGVHNYQPNKEALEAFKELSKNTFRDPS